MRFENYCKSLNYTICIIIPVTIYMRSNSWHSIICLYEHLPRECDTLADFADVIDRDFKCTGNEGEKGKLVSILSSYFLYVEHVTSIAACHGFLSM